MLRKKVLILEDSSQSFLGGGQKITSSVIKSLDFEKYLFDTNRADNFNISKEKILWRPRAVLGNRQVLNLNLKLIIPLMISLMVNNYVVFKFCLKNDRNSIIVYAPTKFGLCCCLLLRTFTNVPILFHAHNVFDDRLLSRCYFQIVKYTAEKVICVSKTVADSMKGVRRKSVVYNPVDVETYPKIQSNGLIKIGIVANFFPYKGHKLFLRSLRTLGETYLDNIDVHFFGAGDREQELKNLVTELELNVSFEGFQETMSRQYAELDCIVIPSILPEAFSLVIAEAWSNEVFVIASDSGAHSELIEDGVTGFLFKNNDIIALRIALEKYLNLSEKHKYEILLAGRDTVGKYSEQSFRREIKKEFGRYC